MPAIPFYEDFRIEEDGWAAFGGTLSKSGNSLVIDASTEAAVAHPWYMAHYGVANRLWSGSVMNHSEGFYCLDHVVHVSDVLRLGLGVNHRIASVYPRCFEFYRDGAATRVIAKAAQLSGFDGAQVSASDTVRLRFSIRSAMPGGNNTFRLAVCDIAGTVLLDTGWLTREYFEANQVAKWCDVVRAGSFADTHLQRIFPVPAWLVPSGTATIDPGTGFMLATVTEAEEFLATGTIAAANAYPPVPTIAVENKLPNVNKVTITCANASAFVYVTVDEGGYDEPANQNKRSICAQGSVSFVLRKPAVIRANSVLGRLASQGEMQQYVGDAVDVAVPEISPAFDYVYGDRPCDVRLHCENGSAVIRYTTDGSPVTDTSPIYTKTLQIRGTRLLRVKAFDGALESPEKYGVYTHRVSGNDLPYYREWDLEDDSAWSYSGNATFGPGTLTVNDPTGLGVVLREDLVGSGKPLVAYRFRASGPFRLKIPGTDVHFAWIGNAVGIVSAANPTPATAFVSQIYAEVRVTCYADSEGNFFMSATVRGNSTTVTFGRYSNIGPAPIASYNMQAIGFSGEGGLAPFNITELETYSGNFTDPGSLFMTSAYPLPVLPVPTLTPATDNAVGATLAPAGAGTLAVERNTSMTFGTIPGTTLEPFPTDAIAGAEYKVTSTEAGSLSSFGLRYFHGSQIVSMLTALDTERSWSNRYATSESRSTRAQYFQMNRDSRDAGSSVDDGHYQSERSVIQNGRARRTWDTLMFTQHNAAFDTGNAWFKVEIEPDAEGANQTRTITPADFRIACGFKIPDAIPLPVLSMSMTGGAPTYYWADASLQKTEKVQKAVLSTMVGTGDSVTVGGPRMVRRFITFLCGRRVSGGRLEVRVALKCDELLTDLSYDTGWVDCGVPGAMSSHRPFVKLQVRSHNGTSNSAMNMNTGILRGYAGLTEAEVDNCFIHGSPSVIPAPVLVPGALNSNGTRDLVVNAADADIVHVFVGDGELRERGTAAGLRDPVGRNEQRVAPGSTITVPAISRVRAVALKTLNPFSVYERRSLVTETDLKPLTSTFVTVETSAPGKISVRCLPRTSTNLYWESGSIGNWVDHYYELVFSDGYRHRVGVFEGDVFERDMRPGAYTVKLVRTWMSSIDFHARQGETEPLAFTVSASAGVTVLAPETAVLLTPANFVATITGGTAPWVSKWTFSDGTSLSGADVNKTFSKPGRYAWEFVASDASRELLVQTGYVVVPYVASALSNMTKSAEVRVS